MSEAPKTIHLVECDDYGWNEATVEEIERGRASLWISATALRELCEKWRKKQKFFYSCEDSKEVRHGTGIREVCDELEKLLEGK